MIKNALESITQQKNLYFFIRSKSLLHMLFERGMVLSYDKILMFINELSETVKALYNDSEDKVLPST